MTQRTLGPPGSSPLDALRRAGQAVDGAGVGPDGVTPAGRGSAGRAARIAYGRAYGVHAR